VITQRHSVHFSTKSWTFDTLTLGEARQSCLGEIQRLWETLPWTKNRHLPYLCPSPLSKHRSEIGSFSWLQKTNSALRWRMASAPEAAAPSRAWTAAAAVSPGTCTGAGTSCWSGPWLTWTERCSHARRVPPGGK